MIQSHTPSDHFIHTLMYNPPAATAWVRGGTSQPQISGIVHFYQTLYGGLLIEAEFFGLPNVNMPGSSDFYGMHLHEYGDCSQNFQNTGSHYQKTPESHPQHSGDFPPLLGNQGYAYSIFYDKRLTVQDIIGKSIVVHSQRDDFTSQPSGDSGEKIACGVVKQGY